MFIPTLQEQMYNLRAQAAVYMLCHEGNLAILPSIKKILKKTKVSILSCFFYLKIEQYIASSYLDIAFFFKHNNILKICSCRQCLHVCIIKETSALL